MSSHQTVSSVYENPRLQALRDKHVALSEKVNQAQKSLSVTDYYLNQLKKQKLLIKEELSSLIEKRRKTSAG